MIIRTQKDRKMKINLPDVPSTLSKLMDVESEFDGRTEKISTWREKHHKEIKKINHSYKGIQKETIFKF